MKNSSIGLDIGTTTLRIAMVSRNKDSFSLDSIAVSPSTPRGINSEAQADHKALSDLITQMLQTSGIKSKEVTVSLPENQVYTKVIEMPQLSEQELAGSLKFEMEQYVPLPLDQVKTDWQILNKKENSGKKTMNVLLVAAPLSLLAKYEKIVEMAGLSLYAVETEIISIYRALSPLINSAAPSMIVHIGASNTNVAILKNNNLETVFSINLGGLALTRAISIDLGIDVVQAENFKKAYGLSQQAFNGKIGRSLQPVLDSLVSDIKKALLLFKEKNSEEVKQLVLSGGSALLPGIDAYFTHTLGAQTILGNCWNAYNLKNVPDEVRVEAPSYSVVIGSALRDVV
ncbi:MAG: hypothetical protein COU27_00590 [Candidatus Levybacteria bacterium CG10_big_fil_rev_8_21_14_0_10_36_7]|nr:MAG: hypothetical protein COU27_00590 [Candidatus Levybacteria bacterium CG10_big_fil_rev_8_21_14_0_10_36_7]